MLVVQCGGTFILIGDRQPFFAVIPFAPELNLIFLDAEKTD